MQWLLDVSADFFILLLHNPEQQQKRLNKCHRAKQTHCSVNDIINYVIENFVVFNNTFGVWNGQERNKAVSGHEKHEKASQFEKEANQSLIVHTESLNVMTTKEMLNEFVLSPSQATN